jgi:hypothetical protein
VTNQRTFSVTLAAAAMVGWWLAPVPEATPALVKPRQDGWRLPALPRAVDQSTVAAVVAGAPYWGRAAAAPVAQATAPVDPRWRIAAVYGVGADRGALIQFAQADRPPQRVRVGDKLPSGHPIVEINHREICIRIGSKTYRLGVERSDSN